MKIEEMHANRLIEKVAEELKRTDAVRYPYKIPIKSGMSSERPPQQKDFWYLRSAALLRKIYLFGPVGVQRLRTAYGGKRRRGHKPAHHAKAGGKFIRTMLQQLEQAGMIAKTEKPRKGRILTPKGQKFLNQVAKTVQ